MLMECELMHKGEPVAVLDIDRNGHILGIASVVCIEHMPPGTVYDGEADLDDLRTWWSNRCIPDARPGIERLLGSLQASDRREMLMGSQALNLSDQYWIRRDPATEWEDASFFRNPFSPDVGDVLFGSEAEGIDPSSPDIATDGVLMKRWSVIDGGRCLAKSGTEGILQEPFNEVIASMLMESQNILHTGYRLEWIDGHPCSVCKDFITEDTELVTAARVVDSNVAVTNGSYRDEYARICKELGIDAHLEQMDLIDAIMMNTDRHLGNYGLIRDAETLEYLGPAPIYDTGTSLMCRTATENIIGAIPSMADDIAKDSRISGRDLEWVDTDAMRDTLPAIEKLLRTGAERLDGRGLSPMRTSALVSVLDNRIDGVERLIRSSHRR